MRKLAKMIVALVAVGSLMFVGTSPATAKNLNKPVKTSTISSGHKSDKTKSDKTKNGKKGKKAKKAKKAKRANRLSKFAPVIDPSPTDAPSCDPMIDKLCEPVVDPTCDPAVNEYCDIVIDPIPTDEPSVDPTPEATSPAVDAWAIYMDALTKAQADYTDVINAAQAEFDTATADAKSTRDSAIDSATSFADIVAAVKAFRLATLAQQADLQAAIGDAQEALSIVTQKAYDQFVANGGLDQITCGYLCWEREDDEVHIDPLPPVPAESGAPAPSLGGKRHGDHQKRAR